MSGDRRARVSAPVCCVSRAVRAPAGRRPGRRGRSPVSSSPHATRARGTPAGAAQSVSRPSRHCLSALRDHTEHTQSRPCRVYSPQSTVQRVQSTVTVESTVRDRICTWICISWGALLSVWCSCMGSSSLWAMAGEVRGGRKGLWGAHMAAAQAQARPCLGVATLQRGAYKTWNTSLRTSQTIVTSSPAPGAPATQGGADTAPPVSTTVQLYPTCAVERRAEIGQPGPTRPVHGQAYPDRLYCAHSLAMHRLWTKQKVSAQSMMPSVRNMVKVCCGRLSPV